MENILFLINENKNVINHYIHMNPIDNDFKLIDINEDYDEEIDEEFINYMVKLGYC